ncbi:MAG TPA: hypothetical protein ENK55_02065 [Actinobacteria bacterium]|nr:hypothetical protein [Actinomycetota bacterium]
MSGAGLAVVVLLVLPAVGFWLAGIVDVLRRGAGSRWGRGGWLVALVLLPGLAAVAYFLTRPAVGAAAAGFGPRRHGASSRLLRLMELVEAREQGVIAADAFEAALAELDDG